MEREKIMVSQELKPRLHDSLINVDDKEKNKIANKIIQAIHKKDITDLDNFKVVKIDLTNELYNPRLQVLMSSFYGIRNDSSVTYVEFIITSKCNGRSLVTIKSNLNIDNRCEYSEKIFGRGLVDKIELLIPRIVKEFIFQATEKNTDKKERSKVKAEIEKLKYRFNIKADKKTRKNNDRKERLNGYEISVYDHNEWIRLPIDMVSIKIGVPLSVAGKVLMAFNEATK